MDISLLFFFFLVLKSDKHLCLALMAWVLVRVAQEARDHGCFRTPSVVNKVHPLLILSLVYMSNKYQLNYFLAFLLRLSKQLSVKLTHWLCF